MKILITGANGMVAREAASHCREIRDNVIALTRQELDISDRTAVHESFRNYMPDAVLNCAAYTDVDGAESHPEAARAANTLGVEYLAEAATEINARLVTISTDYVFDGSNEGFYTEDDQPNPQGVYAATKYEGELAAARVNSDAVIVRSGWIFGVGGTNFLSVMHGLLAQGKTVKAIANSYGTPTFAADLARRLRDLADLPVSGVFHVTNSGVGTSYLGFADKICETRGFDRNLIEPVANEDLKRPAPRPVSSKLGSVRLEGLGLEPLRHWEVALADFVSS